MRANLRTLAILALVALLTSGNFTTAATFELSEGELQFQAPDAWQSVKPAMRLIEIELAVPASKKDDAAKARLTIMQAGGSIGANIGRWSAQFPKTTDPIQQETLEVDGMKVTLIEVAGTYTDAPRGPFGPKVARENYRLIGAIVETKSVGNYFFKLIGPNSVVSPAKEAFHTMLKSLKHKPTESQDG